MTNEGRLIVRILFSNRLLKANNQAFQQLFWAVMTALYKDEFVQVRPQGTLGDDGNDGYLPSAGHYFQVYGPIDPEEKVTVAAEKLADDFEKIKATWHLETPMQAYSFVFNDKYEGTFKKIAQALGTLERLNASIRCRPFTAAHLEDKFMSLSEDGIQSVLGMIVPNPSNAAHISFGVLREVIAHIMSSPRRTLVSPFGDFPELDDKIALNNLCSVWGDLIRTGARKAGHVDQYFSKNSTFMKQALRDHLVEAYREARDARRAISGMPVGISREDLIFDDFRQSLLPENANVAMEGAVEILIGYYFEACDIFDPRAQKDSPNASP